MINLVREFQFIFITAFIQIHASLCMMQNHYEQLQT